MLGMQVNLKTFVLGSLSYKRYVKQMVEAAQVELIELLGAYRVDGLGLVGIK